MASREKFGYSTDRQAETWDAAEADTREEAVAYALEHEPDADVVYVCEQKAGDKAELFDVDDFLDRAEEAASESEDFGHYEDHVFNHSPQSLAHFRAEIDNAIRVWLGMSPGPRIWTTDNITEHRRAVQPVEAQ